MRAFVVGFHNASTGARRDTTGARLQRMVTVQVIAIDRRRVRDLATWRRGTSSFTPSRLIVEPRNSL